MLSRSAAAASATACPATTVPVLAKVPVSYGRQVGVGVDDVDLPGAQSQHARRRSAGAR